MTIQSERAAVGVATDVSSAAMAQDIDTVLLKRVTWGAVFAGIVVALVVQLLLNLLGLGVGLSTVGVNAPDNPDAGSLSLAAAIWWIVAGIIAVFIGGLVAGRMSGRPLRSTAGWHGIITWAGTTLVIAWAVAASVGGLLGGAFNALGSATSSASAAAALAQPNDPFTHIQQDVQRATVINDPRVASAAVMDYLRSAVTESPADAQAARAQAVDNIARAANITPEEANARLTQWEGQYKQAEIKARDAAEVGRKAVAQASICAFIALVLGGIAGWIGGMLGTPTREVTVITAPASPYVP
jgi:hypothetical protein